MRNYNIYVDGKYMYTSLASERLQAVTIAHNEATMQYECSPKYELSWDDWNTMSDDEREAYIDERENKLVYNAILTEEDTIPEDELIYDYVIVNDDSGETSSPGN